MKRVMSNVAANLEQVTRRIHAAARRAGRDPRGITLVAVTKTHPLQTVIEAYQAGLRHFGENRAAEGNAKIEGFAGWLQTSLRAEPAQWHFIGHLQSRQAAQVIGGQYTLVHSVDSLKLAQRINRLAERDTLPPVNILLQCNVSGEATKSGFALERWPQEPAQLNEFLQAVVQIQSLKKLNIQGLMTMAPWFDNPEDARPVFQR
ncbi:MAG: YggS family pyridoxal phosphate-dependent enzyme, partial [Chloroflexi bacterium]